MNIAIVGNGISLLKRENGKDIDSHDLVIRQNFYYKFMNYKLTGLKTDIWACAFDRNGYDDGGRSKEIWCARPLKWKSGGHWNILDTVDKNKITKDICEGEYNRIANIINKAGGTNPTNGFLVLKFTQKLYPNDNIDLYGYDFYEPPNYFYEDEIIDNKRYNHDHSPLVEKKLVEEGVKKGEYRWIQ